MTTNLASLFVQRLFVQSARMDFDYLVIGKGLIGSAAANYLSQTGAAVAIVGPDEPSDIDGAIVFASHYDSGRVQRQIGRNDVMTALNLRAIDRYRKLEQQSGIRFHDGVGCLYVNPSGSDRYLEQAKQRAERYRVDAAFYRNANELAKDFPDFSFPRGSHGMFEPSPSGHIDPRRLIRAQLRVMEKNGGLIVRDVVTGLARRRGRIEVSTRGGHTLVAKKALVAAGAFTNVSSLLPRRLALTLKSETVILARVSEQECRRLATLPSLLFEIDVPEMQGIYSIRPVRYPDGNHYLKMGCNLPEDIFFDGELAEIQRWFRRGASNAHRARMLAALKSVMPNLEIEDCTTKRCILTRTAEHENPYLGQLSEGVFVAVGNGWSAMSSDAIGSVAAHLLREGTFPDGFEPGDFDPVFFR